MIERNEQIWIPPRGLRKRGGERWVLLTILILVGFWAVVAWLVLR